MSNVADTQDITVLSLCTGYGGLELGLSLALENPLRVVGVEIEAYALANLVAKTEEDKLAIEALWPDLRTFPAAKFRGCFDFIVAGYPCQPFSVAGQRKGEVDPRHLWPHIRRIVEAVEPVWCFFENVPGHLSIGFDRVYAELRDLGYAVEAGLFTAAECGAPHKRQRLLILAYRRYDDGSQSRQRVRAGELATAAKREGSQRHKQTVSSEHRSQLADAECSEPGLRIGQIPPTGIGRDRPAIDGESMEHAPGPGRQGGGPALAARQAWPARPGERQYEWEEPRTLDDARSEEPGRLPGRRLAAIRQVGDASKLATALFGQAESPLGGAVDGPSCRVDRLRLLGNGVVPQQAEKAFRYLMGKFEIV